MAKIRINEDNRTAEATELVRTISIVRKSKEILAETTQLMQSYATAVNTCIDQLTPVTNLVKFVFMSKRKKNNADYAFSYLQTILNSKYGLESAKLIDMFLAIDRTPDGVWEDFSKNSVQFFNILEKANPGVLDNDDSRYGLPEELAGEIQKEQLNLTGLKCTLRNYQEWGVKYILHQKRVLLGDEMGLGKTIQAIAAMVSLRNEGATYFIVVCPASVVSNWCREIEKHSDLRVTKIHGSDRKNAQISWISGGGVAVTTYENTANLDIKIPISMLVVDEAHYIKNPEANRTINVKRIASHAEMLLLMTGTALENRVDEMISLIKILQPQMVKQIQDVAFMSSAPMFRERVAPVYYRRKRAEVLSELPDLIESKEWCSMTPEEKVTYEADVFAKDHTGIRRVSWKSKDPANSSKGKRLLEIVEEAEAENRKVIVFSFFLDTIRVVTEILGERCMMPITGAVSPQHRQEIIDEFDEAPAGKVLVAQIQSGGTGLNIQSASVVVICEPQFKPSVENQAISRAYRMGQTRNVLVYRLLCEKTADERITMLLDDKQRIFDTFADVSVAAESDLNKMREAEVDEKTFGKIIEEEIERINSERGEN